MSITVKCYAGGRLGENTYLVTDDKTGYKAVVDPGNYGPEIRKDIGDPSSLKYLLLTHGHHDHFAAVRDYQKDYPDAVFAGPAADTYLMYKSRDNYMLAAGSDSAVCPEADMLVREGDTIELGDTLFRVLDTPGHTEGGICYLADKSLFSGDTLFRLSVGNTSFETGDFDAMVKSIQQKLYTLDDDTVVYPGHGMFTTIGYEKKANPFV